MRIPACEDKERKLDKVPPVFCFQLHRNFSHAHYLRDRMIVCIINLKSILLCPEWRVIGYSSDGGGSILKTRTTETRSTPATTVSALASLIFANALATLSYAHWTKFPPHGTVGSQPTCPAAPCPLRSRPYHSRAKTRWLYWPGT
jgi:hypothetical protein